MVGHLKCTVKENLLEAKLGDCSNPLEPHLPTGDTDPSGLGQTAAATPAIVIIYCQELNALPPGTSLISPVDGVDLSTSSCKKWGC